MKRGAASVIVAVSLRPTTVGVEKFAQAVDREIMRWRIQKQHPCCRAGWCGAAGTCAIMPSVSFLLAAECDSQRPSAFPNHAYAPINLVLSPSNSACEIAPRVSRSCRRSSSCEAEEPAGSTTCTFVVSLTKMLRPD